MTDPLIELLRQECCVLVDGTCPGTGFFVTPDLVLTCAHVIGPAKVGTTVPIKRSSRNLIGRIVGIFPHDNDDLALLKVGGEPGVPVPLQDDAWPGDELYACGFPDSELGQAADGFLAHYEGRTEVADDRRPPQKRFLHKFKDAHVVQGFSGGPLVNLRTTRAIGVVSHTRSAENPIGGWAIPVSFAITFFSRTRKKPRFAFEETSPRWSEVERERSRTLVARQKKILAGSPAMLLESAERESVKQLEHFTREISTALAHLDDHVKFIAESPEIVRFLKDSKNETKKQTAHQILLSHTSIGPYATTFILDRYGICIENSRHELSIGKDYSLRPYFEDAMQKKVGRFPAIGVTSGVLGHHVAYPVCDKGEIIGVACVEVDMEYLSTQSDAFVHTETRGGDRPWIRVLTDQNGVIMLSSEESWRYRAVATMPEDILQLVRQTKQYPGHDLAELDRFDSPDTQHLASLMRSRNVRGYRWKDSFGQAHDQAFVISETKTVGGWRIMIFWSLATLSQGMG
jgi:hypothetical protein